MSRSLIPTCPTLTAGRTSNPAFNGAPAHPPPHHSETQQMRVLYGPQCFQTVAKVMEGNTFYCDKLCMVPIHFLSNFHEVGGRLRNRFFVNILRRESKLSKQPQYVVFHIWLECLLFLSLGSYPSVLFIPPKMKGGAVRRRCKVRRTFLRLKQLKSVSYEVSWIGLQVLCRPSLLCIVVFICTANVR